MAEVCSTTWQHMTNLLFIGIGGFLGAIARYSLTIGITNRIGGHFLVGTLAVNFSGWLLLALFTVWSARQLGLPEHLRLMIGTGFFGAYTTFSTFANESIALMQTGHWTAALGNIIGTNLLCLLGVLVGLALATRWFTS
jgi:fluoride exporter